MSVSVTTRPPRDGEKDGVDYQFVDETKFARMVDEEGFLEHAMVFGNAYGTPRTYVEKALKAGHDVLRRRPLLFLVSRPASTDTAISHVITLKICWPSPRCL